MLYRYIFPIAKSTFNIVFFVFVFLHPHFSDIHIVVSWRNIVLTNHTSMECSFIQLSDVVNLNKNLFSINLHSKKMTLMINFVVQGHILEFGSPSTPI